MLRLREALFSRVRRSMHELWRRLRLGRGDVYPASRGGTARGAGSTAPRVNLYDAGASLILRADVPGLSQEDVTITLRGGELSIAGERRVVAPEGYWARRRERLDVRFSRVLALPCPVTPDQVEATVRDGLLTLTLAKADAPRPRRGPVEARGGHPRRATLAEWTRERLSRLRGGDVPVTSALDARTGGRAALPALDLFENEREVRLVLDVPGATPSRTHVSWNELDTLAVFVQRRAAPLGSLCLSELDERDGYREIALPPDADGARARAHVRDGVLTVRVPKRRTASGDLLPLCAA